MRDAESEPYDGQAGRATLQGFRRDEEGHWVALLSCGHTQHLRHSPPWQLRGWVLDAASRARRIGLPFDCGWCRQTDSAEGGSHAGSQRSGNQLR